MSVKPTIIRSSKGSLDITYMTAGYFVTGYVSWESPSPLHMAGRGLALEAKSGATRQELADSPALNMHMHAGHCQAPST